MKKSKEVLDELFGAYYNSHFESLSLQEKYLKQGFTIKTKPFIKSPKLPNLVSKNLSIPADRTCYLSNYRDNPMISQQDPMIVVNGSKFYFFFDDIFKISVSDPSIPSLLIDGESLIQKMNQGINGSLPKMIKKAINRPVKGSEYESKEFELSIQLVDSPDSWRSKIMSHYSPELNQKVVADLLNPINLFSRHFHGVINIGFGTSNRLTAKQWHYLNHRFLLWGFNPPKQRKDAESSIKNLPFSDFGVKDIALLQLVNNRFSNPVDNTFLLTGQGSKEHFDYLRCLDLLNRLKSPPFKGGDKSD